MKMHWVRMNHFLMCSSISLNLNSLETLCTKIMAQHVGLTSLLTTRKRINEAETAVADYVFK